MSDSANPSPTGLLSPSDEVGGNGFTAVNPPGGPKSGRMAEGDISRNSQDVRNHAFEHAEMHRNGNGSPMNGAGKRKRSSVGSNEEESDESASNDESPAGDSLQSSVRNYPGPPPPPPTGDPRDRAWNNNNGHGRPMEVEESRLAEALQRENQGGPGLNGHNGMMEDDRGMGRSYYPNEHNGIITTNAGVQMDPKKRKRVSTFGSKTIKSRSNYCQAFTNRTKTGCQTCRRRKKKCDEAKPECTLPPVPFVDHMNHR